MILHFMWYMYMCSQSVCQLNHDDRVLFLHSRVFTYVHFFHTVIGSLSLGSSHLIIDIEISEWSSQADGTRLRDISYTLSLNYSFGPKYSSCTEHQVYFKNGQLGVKHIVQSDVSGFTTTQTSKHSAVIKIELILYLEFSLHIVVVHIVFFI